MINKKQGMLNLNDDFFLEGIIFIKPSNRPRLQRGCSKFAFVTQPKNSMTCGWNSYVVILIGSN